MTFRVVLDTNQVIAAGSRWVVGGRPNPDSNASRRILIAVAETHTGLYCAKIVGEYLEKLVEIGHPYDRALKLMTYIMGAFEKVTIVTSVSPHAPTDPDDEVFILCALDGNADYLVSDDNAVLALKPHYPKPIIGNCKDVSALLGC